MKEAQKILYVTQEMEPYLPESPMATLCRRMPQKTQEDGREMRAFMPRFGCINERRNQLHEVIRLSGMNMIIDDTDHSLIIKVASIQSARMQVYFIDNEDYFKRKATVKDADGKEFEDNDERTIFFSRGVIETVRKLRWEPTVVSCNGWIAALMPLYIKKAYADDPQFMRSKIVTVIYEDDFKVSFPDKFRDFLMLDGIEKEDIQPIDKEEVTYVNLMKLALRHSDGVVFTSTKIQKELFDEAKKLKIPSVVIDKDSDYEQEYLDFYDLVAKQ